MSIVTWLVILLLLLANSLYVAAEFAAVGVRRPRLRRRAEQGSRLAQGVLDVVEDTKRLDRYIATCQVGITFSSLILGAYGQVALTPALAPLVGAATGAGDAAAFSTAAILVLALLTALQVLIGELVPKSLALQFPTRTAMATLLPVRWSARILAPFIWLLNGSALAILRAMRLPAGSHHQPHGPREIEVLLAESREGGMLEAEEHQRVRAALRLRAANASQLMVPLEAVVSVPEDTPLRDVAKATRTMPFTRIPMHDGQPDRITGFLHTKDLFLQRVSPDPARSLAQPALRVPAALAGDRLLATLREQGHQVAVVEDGGRAVGIVSMDDVLAGMLRPTGGTA